MLRVMILMLAVFPILAACADWRGGGTGLSVPDLPAQARQECQHPSTMLGAGDWEIIAGRIGDELIRCEGRRGLAVHGYDGVREALGQ